MRADRFPLSLLAGSKSISGASKTFLQGSSLASGSSLVSPHWRASRASSTGAMGLKAKLQTGIVGLPNGKHDPYSST